MRRMTIREIRAELGRLGEVLEKEGGWWSPATAGRSPASLPWTHRASARGTTS